MYIHGMRHTKTYKSWAEMKQRCLNQNNTVYDYYGGRGITICDEWMDFQKFLDDMGECPKGMSIDRIDNSKGYYAENCRWANKYQQARNKRNNRLIEFNGEIKPLSQWAEEYNLLVGTLWRRINKGLNPPECFYPVGKISRGAAARMMDKKEYFRMSVYGHKITLEQYEKIVQFMKDGFVSNEIEKYIIELGIPEYANIGKYHKASLAMRVADRIIQRERKTGNIYFKDGCWYLTSK